MILSAPQYAPIDVNSTSYVDLLGVPLGLDRLPGETSDAYLVRLMTAAQLDRSAQYQGLVNEINLQLGFEPAAALLVYDSTGSFSLASDFTALYLKNSVETLTIPLFTYDPDDFWSWRRVSDVRTDIAASRSFSAALLEDGFAWQIASQSNTIFVASESIAGQDVQLNFGPVVPGSVSFSVPVSDYAIAANGKTLRFSSPVPAGTTAAYWYQTSPWNLILTRAGILSLLDPKLATAALAPSGNLVYQVREYLQAVAAKDQSYWAK